MDLYKGFVDWTSLYLQPLTLLEQAPHQVGYQNPEPFVWLILIGLKSKQAKQKVPDFGIPTSAQLSDRS